MVQRPSHSVISRTGLLVRAAPGSCAFLAMATGVHRSCLCWPYLGNACDLLAAGACTNFMHVSEERARHSRHKRLHNA